MRRAENSVAYNATATQSRRCASLRGNRAVAASLCDALLLKLACSASCSAPRRGAISRIMRLESGDRHLPAAKERRRAIPGGRGRPPSRGNAAGIYPGPCSRVAVRRAENSVAYNATATQRRRCASLRGNRAVAASLCDALLFQLAYPRLFCSAPRRGAISRIMRGMGTDKPSAAPGLESLASLESLRQWGQTSTTNLEDEDEGRGREEVTLGTGKLSKVANPGKRRQIAF